MDKLTLSIQPRAPVGLGIEGTKPLGLILEQGHSIDWYAGSYECIPTMYEQGLATKDKMMRDDVTVHAIPVEQVSNTSGGYTVTIGG